MNLEFSVKVEDGNGNGVSGAEVSVHFGGILYGGTVETEYTDGSGWAYFSVPSDCNSARGIYVVAPKSKKASLSILVTHILL